MESTAEIKKYFPILKFHYKVLIDTPLNPLMNKVGKKKKKREKENQHSIQNRHQG